MTKCLAWAVVLAVALVACKRSSSADATGAEESAKTPVGEECSLHAMGLEGTTPVVRYQPPAGCTASGHPPALPKKVSSEADFAAYYQCVGGKSGLDFTKQDLWVADGSLSPAETGIIAVDDGFRVTVVQQFRSPCPSDPHPVPVSDVFAFVLPHDALRAVARAQCTVQSPCK